jgi:hypothetical protein
LRWRGSGRTDDPTTGRGRAESLDNAQRGLTYLYERIARTTEEPLASESAFEGAYNEVLASLNDDLNVPKAVATLHTYGSPRLWKAFDPVLALDFENRAKLPEEEAAPADVLRLSKSVRRPARRKTSPDPTKSGDRSPRSAGKSPTPRKGPTVKRKA